MEFKNRTALPTSDPSAEYPLTISGPRAVALGAISAENLCSFVVPALDRFFPF